MKTTIKNVKPYVLLCLLTLPLRSVAADINQSETNAQEQIRQQERQRVLRRQQEIKPDARDTGEQLKSSAPVAIDIIPDNETPCFIISKIELIGDSVNQFQFALDEVLAHGCQSQNNSSQHPAPIQSQPILGSCLGVIGINAVMARVQNSIIAKGYITTRVDIEGLTLDLDFTVMTRYGTQEGVRVVTIPVSLGASHITH
ncbi:MAG: POTRA domain-containing protein [Methylotenera sp.]|nr:POTRA domain-containing protein [Methylotenera sp.]